MNNSIIGDSGFIIDKLLEKLTKENYNNLKDHRHAKSGTLVLILALGKTQHVL
jgi:hypothetical protein